MAIFRQVYAVDTNGQPVAAGNGRIFDVEDTGGELPLVVTDASGVPMATVSITEAGVSQAFVVEDHTQVRWISENGEIHVIFESLSGMEETARSAEATALSVLDQIARFLESVGAPGGVAALNSEGEVVNADADVIGNDTRRPGAVTWAYGSTAVRPTASREVMVIWITEGPAPVNALAGVDIWFNGGVVR